MILQCLQKRLFLKMYLFKFEVILLHVIASDVENQLMKFSLIFCSLTDMIKKYISQTMSKELSMLAVTT